MVSEQFQVFPQRQKYPHSKTIGLISDTHIPVKAEKIPRKVHEVFDKVDFIVHAGDLVQLQVIDELEQIAPVLAVYGNMDEPKVRNTLAKLSSAKIFNWKIGVVHNPGTPFRAGKMCDIASQNSFNVLVYGHTHNASIKWIENNLFINPGSPTNPIPTFITKPTVALLRITPETITPEIIHV